MSKIEQKKEIFVVEVGDKKIPFFVHLFAEIAKFLTPPDFFAFIFSTKVITTFFSLRFKSTYHIAFIEFYDKTDKGQLSNESAPLSTNLMDNIMASKEVPPSEKNAHIQMMRENENFKLIKEYSCKLQYNGEKKANGSNSIGINKIINGRLSGSIINADSNDTLDKNDKSVEKSEKKVNKKCNETSEIISIIENNKTIEKNRINTTVMRSNMNYFIDIYGVNISLKLDTYFEKKTFIKRILKRYSGIFFIMHGNPSSDMYLRKVKEFTRNIRNVHSMLLFGFKPLNMQKITGTFSLLNIRCYDISKLNEMKNFEKQKRAVTKILCKNISKNSIDIENKMDVLYKLISTTNSSSSSSSLKLNSNENNNNNNNNESEYGSLLKKLVNKRMMKFYYFNEKEGKLLDICQVLRVVGFKYYNDSLKLFLVKKLFNNYIFVKLEKKKGIRVLRKWNYKGKNVLQVVKRVYTPPTFEMREEGHVYCNFWLLKETQYHWFFERRALIIPHTLFAILGNSDAEMSLKIPTVMSKIYNALCTISCYYCFNNPKLKI